MTAETIAIVGGSSAFTPALAGWLARSLVRTRELEVRLVGRSAARVEAVARACRHAAAEGGAPHSYLPATSAAHALSGADLVLLAFRPGGFRARAEDEAWCAARGVPYDETIGPGALFGAVRAGGTLHRTAALARRVGNDPLVVNLVNPMGILLADLRNRLPDAGVIGLCELPEFTVRRCLEVQGLSPDLEVVVTHRGVNHQGWILGIEDREGRDLLDPVLSGPVHDDPCFAGIAGRPPDEPGIALCYLRLHREEGRRGWLRASGRSRRGRGAELEDLAERIHAAHRAGADSRQLLAGRDTRWYDLAVGPLIASRLGVSSARLWVSAPQGGVDPDLPADAIMERQTLVRESRWLRSSAAPRHAAHTDLLRRVIAFDEACATSVRDPSERNVRAALAIHPWGLSSSFVGAAARRCLEVQSWATCSTD